ncbi:molybdenum cofactor guanylyltransferase [Paenibacillus sp. KQZ6P-2]|uniref:Molybdenum cofactor guanylyltransferase n=1 Tax=Paenibacillus mangrovi TaxID=2931978 RepID=A0A9X1WVR8_9BACL|nr:molybdenum cofactor guanylyltransferase [Paenibacillus mangrovi]
MGKNKALLAVGRERVIDTIMNAMSSVVQDVLIASNDREAYLELGKEIVEDRFPGQGPLSGIHAALQAAKTPWIIVAACDMPFVSSDLIHYLTKTVHESQTAPAGGIEYQAVVPLEEGRVQPLLAAYHVSSLPALEESLRSGKLRMTDWLAQLQVRYISEEALFKETGMNPGHVFFNMNSPEDYNLVLKKQEDQEAGR